MGSVIGNALLLGTSFCVGQTLLLASDRNLMQTTLKKQVGVGGNLLAQITWIKEASATVRSGNGEIHTSLLLSSASL